MDIRLTISSITHKGGRIRVSKLCPSNCLDFLLICNSCKLQRDRKLSEYLVFRSSFSEKRGFKNSYGFALPMFIRFEPLKSRGHPEMSAEIYGQK
jgi:hypothetical protein